MLFCQHSEKAARVRPLAVHGVFVSTFFSPPVGFASSRGMRDRCSTRPGLSGNYDFTLAFPSHLIPPLVLRCSSGLSEHREWKNEISGSTWGHWIYNL